MNIRPGDEVKCNYPGLDGCVGIVRSVYEDVALDQEDKRPAISVRIPFDRLPAGQRNQWMRDPEDPAFAPMTLFPGEYELHKRGV